MTLAASPPATPGAPLLATSNIKTTALELSLSPTHPVEHAEFTVSRPGQLSGGEELITFSRVLQVDAILFE